MVKPRSVGLTAALALVLALAGCAGENVPEAQLARAQLAVDRAVAAQAGTHAPTEFARAQSQLRAAREAIDEEDYTEARRLADQAEINATLAETRAQAAVETENAEQMRGTVGDLRETAVPPPTTLMPQ
jgi:hypothetical protein